MKGAAEHLRAVEGAPLRRLFFCFHTDGEGVTAELLMAPTSSAGSLNKQRAIGTCFHWRTPRPSIQRRQVRPPDRPAGAHIQPAEAAPGPSLPTDTAACGLSA